MFDLWKKNYRFDCLYIRFLQLNYAFSDHILIFRSIMVINSNHSNFLRLQNFGKYNENANKIANQEIAIFFTIVNHQNHRPSSIYCFANYPTNASRKSSQPRNIRFFKISKNFSKDYECTSKVSNLRILTKYD